ncbi:MAG: hypothetical protein Q4G66_10820, partial [bacterium]|nr:hypothetical protein [bacterium]
WDITDEYLQELADELAHLAPDWQDDKVASLYLQGMGKIGKYLRLRGAHAHPNSIKLLLTYFHHFETIVSTPDLGSDRIAQMVHNDVRKFKVLQYQIKLKEEGVTAEDAAAAGKGLAISRETGEAEDSLRNFKAAILELDWEVSDDSLARFSAALKALGEEKLQNRAALILIQGMQALGQYISDERAHAHPEVFTLLHSFHDGLEQMLDTGPTALGSQQKKKILLDRVNRLNHLKKLIAPKDSEIPAAIPIPQATAPTAPSMPAAAGETHEDAATPAFVSETETTQAVPAPAAVETLADAGPEPTPPAEMESVNAPQEPDVPGSDEESTLAEEDIFAGIEAANEPEADVAVQPSLAADFPIELDMDEKQPVADTAGIESEIDALFAGSSKRAMLSSEEEYPDEILPESAYQAVDDEVSDSFIDTNIGERHGITPALAGVVEEAGLEEAEEPLDMETKIDLDEQLDFLFGDSPQGAEQSEPAASLFDEEFEDPAAPVESLPLEEVDLFAEAPVEAAFFAESTEETALSLEDAAAAEAPAAVLEPEPAPPAAGLDDDEEEDDEGFLARTHDDLPAALAEAEIPEEDELVAAEPDEEITSKLDSFFDFAVSEEKPELQSEDVSLFADEVLSTEPDAVVAEETAFAIEPASLAAEDTENTYEAMPAALADAEIPEEDQLAAEEPADKELTDDLDNFFAAADEAIAPVPSPVPEQEEPAAIALEEKPVSPEAETFDDVVAALSDVESAEELFADQAEDNEDPVLQDELDNFFDALSAAELEPTDVERAILAVEPEETEEEYFEESAPASLAGTEPLESALADVAFSEKTAGQSIEVDPAIEHLVNSFWDDKPSAAATATTAASPPEPATSDEAFTLAEEEAAEGEAETVFAPPAAQEELFSGPETPAPAEALFGLEEQEASAIEAAATEEVAFTEAAELESGLFTDSQEQELEETALSDTLPGEQDLFASARDTEEVAAELVATEPAAEELQLESSLDLFSPSAEGFEDILDSSEVQEFLLSGQDIEDIPDEELEFTLEDAGDSEEAALAADTLLPSLQEEAPFAAPAGAVEEPEAGADEDNAGQVADVALDLTASSGDKEAVFAPAEEDAPTTDDELPSTSAFWTAPPADIPEDVEETVLDLGEEEAQTVALAALGASLPVLLANYTAEHLSNTSLHLKSVREAGRLSPVQNTAAGMLETVITALPRHTGQGETNRAVLDKLYQALAQPQEHLPLATVTAYADWVQSLLFETLLSGTGEAATKEYFTARDIFQELSGFRIRMEEELAQLRREIRNK